MIKVDSSNGTKGVEEPVTVFSNWSMTVGVYSISPVVIAVTFIKVSQIV